MLNWSGRRDSNPRPPPWQGGALPLSHFRSCPSWCRGGDLNPYALSGTAPSRRRVYLFHHLGSPRSILHILPRLASLAVRRRTPPLWSTERLNEAIHGRFSQLLDLGVKVGQFL